MGVFMSVSAVRETRQQEAQDYGKYGVSKQEHRATRVLVVMMVVWHLFCVWLVLTGHFAGLIVGCVVGVYITRVFVV